MSTDGDNHIQRAYKTPWVQPFLQQMVNYRNYSKSTCDSYAQVITKFHDYIISFFPEVSDLQFVERQHIVAYKVFMENKGNARATISLAFACLKSLYTWMMDEKYIDQHPFPSRMTSKVISDGYVWLPPIEKVFLCRKLRQVRKVSAALFECFLSTGLRSHEAAAIRMRNVYWDEVPYDKETGKPSIYFKGKIILPVKEHRLKGRRSRIVWLSNLANKLMRDYIKLHNIPYNSDVPIFPFNRKHMEIWLMNATRDILPFCRWNNNQQRTKRTRTDKSRSVDDPRDRIETKPYVEGYTDLTESDMKDSELSEEFLAKVKNIRDNANKDNPIERQALIRSKRHRIWFHTHLFRHMAACMFYYRNPYGERSNFERLRQLLGHVSKSDVTFDYLKSLDYIQDDATWARVYNGNGMMDWFMTIVDPPKRGTWWRNK